MDQAVASLVVSRNEFDQLQALIEDETVEGFKQELESTLNNTLIFDAYLKRYSMDPRLLGNMAECRVGGILSGILEKLNDRRSNCDRPTLYKRLAKIFPNQTEAQIREAFATPQSQQQFMNERQREMIERYAPVIHNQKLNPPADACIPFKSSLMISMPPADQRQLMQLLLYQGANEDLAGKRAMAANMLNLPALSRDLPLELVPLGENYQDNSNIQHSVDVINNDPLFLLAFQDKDLRQKLHQHRQAIDECEENQRTQYEAAVGPQRTARATELQAQFASACNGLQAAALRTCQSKIRRRAIDQAEKESVSRLAWTTSSNQPRCPTIADFFSQQQNINDLIKSQNQRCYETKKNDLPGFLCTPALPALTPEQLAFKMAPKIYEHFGATHAPRLISAYLNQHFCPAASDGDGVSADDAGEDDAPIGAVSEAKANPYSTLLDPERPVSDLTRWRQGGDAMENSQYARLNRALCPKLRGTRASGEAYSCAQSPTPPECSSSAQLKAMACRALDEELAAKSLTLSAPERMAIHRYPTDDQSLNRVANYSVTNTGGQVASEVLELQRFANSLPGAEVGAGCDVAGAVASGADSVRWLDSDSAVAAGSGSGGNGAGTNAVFSDYFLAAESSDEESLRTFASANPSIASGNPDAGVPTTPYTRRLTPAPPSSTGESLVAPVEAAPVAAVPATAAEDVNATTPVAAPLASSGSIEQRVPPLIAAPVDDIVPEVPSVAPVVDEREGRDGREAPVRRDSPDERKALQTELDEYQRTLREYDRELKRMEREELERLRDRERIVGSGPSPIVPKRKNPMPVDDGRPGVLPGGDGGDNGGGSNEDGNVAAVDGNGGSADSRTTSLSDKGDVVDEKQGDKTIGGGGKAARAPASVGGAGVAALAANLSNKGRGLLAQFQEAPIEESLDKQFGIPGIRDADDHYSFESTLVIPQSLMKYGVAKVVRALELEAMNFAVLARDTRDPKNQRLKIIVYSWNPENLNWEVLSTRTQIAQRIRLKRFADELRTLKMHDDLDDIAQGARASHHHTLKEAQETRAARHNLLTPARHEQVLKTLRQR